jgi:predicted membrane protein
MDLAGLGNLRAADIAVWGQMGELSLDLGESLQRDTKMYARMRMGEMRIGIPTDARVQASSSMFLGETVGNPNRAEGAHLLDLDVSSSMGQLTYHLSQRGDEPL